MGADGWTEMLQEVRDAALVNTNVTEVASGIERHHYNLMERIRVGYQQDIVIHLLQLTGDQLGDDPKPWIEKYGKPE